MKAEAQRGRAAGTAAAPALLRRLGAASQAAPVSVAAAASGFVRSLFTASTGDGKSGDGRGAAADALALGTMHARFLPLSPKSFRAPQK